MKRTTTTLHGAAIVAIAAAVLGTISDGASATQLAVPAAIYLDRSGSSPAMPVRSERVGVRMATSDDTFAPMGRPQSACVRDESTGAK